MSRKACMDCSFNTQPPEGGWSPKAKRICSFGVSTHSRPKAADAEAVPLMRNIIVSTHSRPKAAGLLIVAIVLKTIVSTHSRPKAAAKPVSNLYPITEVSTHSRPKAAERFYFLPACHVAFQHTAARRRLLLILAEPRARPPQVSTHSRPKAAEPLLKALFHQVSQPRFR